MKIYVFNMYFLIRLSELRTDMLRYTDDRVKLTNEILQGIRAIKSYNWEVPFTEKLKEIRNLELKALQASSNTRAIIISILSASPAVVAVLTLGVYASLGNILSPAKVFTSLALFNQLRFPLIFYPMLLNTLAEGKVSLDRLDNFLKAGEVDDYIIRNKNNHNDNNNNNKNGILSSISSKNQSDTSTSTSWSSSYPRPTPQEDTVVEISGGDFSWTHRILDQNEPKSQYADRGRLSSTNIKIRRGELVAVIGPVCIIYEYY